MHFNSEGLCRVCFLKLGDSTYLCSLFSDLTIIFLGMMIGGVVEFLIIKSVFL